MTRQHFQALADALKASRPTTKGGKASLQWDLDVVCVGDVCRQFNHGFSRELFERACGGRVNTA